MNTDGDKINEWKSQVESCKAGGLTVKAWCNENGISPKTYYYRQKRIRENESVHTVVPISSFPRMHKSEICIVKNGLHIILPLDVSPELILNLVNELC